jgi:pimeloyl-ACP methyl ester carboxylesterase
MKTVLEFAGLLIILFAGISLLLYFFQERMIFFPQPTTPGNAALYASHAVTFRHGEVELKGWFFKARVGPDHPLIVYYGGNAEDISLNFTSLDRFATRSFLFMNYRGYGGSGGRPAERALCEDALFVLDTVIKTEGIDPGHVILVGRSLGSGVAVYVAARHKVGGIILVTPFDSLTNVARVHYPIFPVRLLLKHRFDSASVAPGITTPALFLTAANDQVVPVRLANKLERIWGGPTTGVVIGGADHNTIDSFPAYWEAINTFLQSDRRGAR